MPQNPGRIAPSKDLMERTFLNNRDEGLFQNWVARNGITDVDDPKSFYDYRGFWKQNPSFNKSTPDEHFPDTFKQHGHPTFSQESEYSRGPWDGGMWLNETFFPPMSLAVSHKKGK
jgi:hypothetical protein